MIQSISNITRLGVAPTGAAAADTCFAASARRPVH